MYCGLPPNITDGYYHNSTGVIYESEVRYKCFPGFYISSSDAITCDNSGSWSKPPSCIGLSLIFMVNSKLLLSFNYCKNCDKIGINKHKLMFKIIIIFY